MWAPKTNPPGGPLNRLTRRAPWPWPSRAFPSALPSPDPSPNAYSAKKTETPASVERGLRAGGRQRRRERRPDGVDDDRQQLRRDIQGREAEAGGGRRASRAGAESRRRLGRRGRHDGREGREHDGKDVLRVSPLHAG